MTSVLLPDQGGQTETCCIFLSKTWSSCWRPAYWSQSCSSGREDCNGVQGFSRILSTNPADPKCCVFDSAKGQKISHLSAVRWVCYYAILLEVSKITVRKCNVLNPAALLPTEGDGDQDKCVVTITTICIPRPDLQKTPLQNPNFELFIQTLNSLAFRSSDTGAN